MRYPVVATQLATRVETTILPEGKTCFDCLHFHVCHARSNQSAEATICTISPSEFFPATPEFEDKKRKFHEIEMRVLRCYSAMELWTKKICELVAEIDAGPPKTS